MIKPKDFIYIIGALGLSFFSLSAFSVLPGAIVTDDNNYWGHNGKFSSRSYKATYVICDGYIGSPLIPNSADAVSSFANNCEETPTSGSLPIIDVAENHSTNYQGYPAYTVKPPTADHAYFVCDGFLNSTAWCSYEAHVKAQKLRRAAESRFWEIGSTPEILDDKPASEAIAQRLAQKNTYMVQDERLERAQRFSNESQTTYTAPRRTKTISPELAEQLNIPVGSKLIPLEQKPGYSQRPSFMADSNQVNQRKQVTQTEIHTVPTENKVITLSTDVKNFLVQTIEDAVNKSLDKRLE
jgi:hypothetical protein